MCLLTFLFQIPHSLATNVNINIMDSENNYQAVFSILQAKLEDVKHNRTEGGCLMWVGHKTPKGYGVLYYTVNGNNKRMKAHRAAYFVRHRVLQLDDYDECSHLCNRCACIEPGHIVAESKAQNQERRHCFEQGSCTEGHWPHCIFV